MNQIDWPLLIYAILMFLAIALLWGMVLYLQKEQNDDRRTTRKEFESLEAKVKHVEDTVDSLASQMPPVIVGHRHSDRL